MLKRERQRQILRMIEGSGKVEVSNLARHFDVSDMTIRRDLSELNDRGLIERVHGGALLEPGGGGEEPPVVERSRENAEIKRRIGIATAGIIQNGEKIFLGSGSTTLAVAEALAHHRNLTVVTNALNIANALIPYSEISVVLIGGFLRRSELSLIGHFAENALRGLQVNKVIMGIRGIDPVKGLTSDHLQELITDQAILNISKEVIIVTDNSKFGYVGAIRTAPITTATKIVTNLGGPKDILDAIRRMGITIIEV
jgi:DeoR/GlpR family transcriptional regulator of sugar metabolism